MSSEAARQVTRQDQSASAMRIADRPKLQLVRKVEVDRSRDALLTAFGKTTLEDRYLLPGESYQDMFARVATAFADDADHAQRVVRVRAGAEVGQHQGVEAVAFALHHVVGQLGERPQPGAGDDHGRQRAELGPAESPQPVQQLQMQIAARRHGPPTRRSRQRFLSR